MFETTNQYIYIYYPIVRAILGGSRQFAPTKVDKRLVVGHLHLSLSAGILGSENGKILCDLGCKKRTFQMQATWVQLGTLNDFMVTSMVIHSVTDLLLVFWAVTVGVSKHGQDWRINTTNPSHQSHGVILDRKYRQRV